MAIVAASIETNGWVLRLDVTATLGGFGAYTLDPNGVPRVTLASNHAGFVKSAGTAVAGTIARSLVATKPLRKPVNWNGSGIDPFVIDEVDLGGGVIRVRIALSEHIYATDTGLSLSILAGWRAGEAAASGIAVTNNSTCLAPIPIMRWALAPYEVTPGAFRVSLLVFSHHPTGFEPVAGVKFTATDGTNTKTVWATELATDNSYGDNLRCYTAIIDPATATALTAGLLRCDAEVYPWLGAMRSTDTAGTRSMTGIRVAALRVGAANPWVIGYDPDGTRYGSAFAFVDPVNGTTTAAAGMIAATLAGAKAVAPASRPKDIITAIQAGYLANRTLPAANGQTAGTRSVDNLQAVLAAGTHIGLGPGNVTSGAIAYEIPVRMVGDPADPDPRTNIILQTAPRGIERVDRVRVQRLALECGTNSLCSSFVYIHIDDIVQRGKTGQESNSVSPFSGVSANDQFNIACTRSRFWRFGANIGSGSAKVGFARACEHTRPFNSTLTAVKNRVIGAAEDSFVSSTTAPYLSFSSNDIGAYEDVILAYNTALFLAGPFCTGTRAPAALAGTLNPSMRRNAIVGNVMERIGGGSNAFWSFGERESQTISYNIIEGNTGVGDRANTNYNDPVPRVVTVRGNSGVAANAIQNTGHGYANGTLVRYYGTSGAPVIPGLTFNTNYYVVNTAANSFQLAATSGGTPLTITANASSITGQNFANVDDTYTLANQAFVNRVANNAFDWMPSKHDAFSDPQVQQARGTSNGYRPQLIDGWSMLYGVGNESNVLTERVPTTPGQFGLEFTGLRSIDGYAGALAPLYTVDRSIAGPDGAAATGGGNYRPLAGSPLLGRAVRANADVDAVGLPRSVPFAAGAFQTPSVTLAPAAGRSGSRAGPTAIEAVALIAPARAFMAQRATIPFIEPRLVPASSASLLRDKAPNLAWAGALAPAPGRHQTTVTQITLVMSSSIAPANMAMAQSARSPLLSIDFPLLPAGASTALRNASARLDAFGITAMSVDAGRLPIDATAPLLLVPGVRSAATLVIGPDPRTLIPNRN